MQAARGASLSPSDQTADAGGSRAPGRPRSRAGVALVMAAVFGLAWGADLLTKTLAVRHLEPGVPVDLAGSWVRLLLTRNPGAAFSAATAFTEVLTVIAVAAAAVIVRVGLRARSVGWAATLGLLLGGVVGNLTDRLFRAPSVGRGHVVDFVALPHWPVFNVADVCIDVSAALILLLVFRGYRLDGSRGS